MQFYSQICTNIEQSKQLLEAGLNPNTSDLFYLYHPTDNSYEVSTRDHFGKLLKEDIPAWSLHRLMEIGNLSNLGFIDLTKAYTICVNLIIARIKTNLINSIYTLKRKTLQSLIKIFVNYSKLDYLFLNFNKF